MMKQLTPILLLLVFTFSKCNKNKKAPIEPSGAVELKDSVFISGRSHIWEILWGPDNEIWMTERDGKISKVNPKTGSITELLDIPEVISNGEGGLLGMALAPDFNTTKHVFVSYNYSNSSADKEKVVRYTLSGNTLTSPFTIIDNISAASIHNGSRLIISADQKLFISTGDAADQSLPQNTNSLNGKILRLNLDGSIPADNPFAGNPVWSFGHRNPQGLVFVNGALFSSEHGPNNDDEINIIEKGHNYGWPDVQGFCNTTDEKTFCTANNVKEPIMAWTPTIATAGLDYYNSDLIPQWKNSLLLATLKNQRIYQMKLDDQQKEVMSTNEYYDDKYGRLRDICISPDGKVYISTSNGSDDKIIVISPK